MAEGATDSTSIPAMPSSGASPQLAPAVPESNKKGKNTRNRKTNLPLPQRLDGSVSDSVTTNMNSTQSKKGSKPRLQSAAVGAPPKQNVQQGKVNGQKPRPVSMGGNMLPATPMKEQAYAGPTFQASPAPSSLPVPKFFASRSVPNVAQHTRSLEAAMAGQKTPEKEESSPDTDVVSPEPPSRAAQQSPLDLFFNAQKAENQRLRSPEMRTRQAPSATEPRDPFQQSGKSIFLRETNGEDAMPSPKTVPPNDRNHEAYTQSLKDLLFNAPNGTQPQQVTSQHQRSASNLQSPPQEFFTPSPFNRPASGPSTPAPNVEHQNQYSPHYGNRNLSPLFKAARGDTPARPSNLRQNSAASDSTSSGPSPQPRPIDPNTFSRNYLDQHIRASQPAPFPDRSSINGVNSQNNESTSFPPLRHGVPMRPPSDASPRTASTQARDVRSMEDDLRRMLNLNVLGT